MPAVASPAGEEGDIHAIRQQPHWRTFHGLFEHLLESRVILVVLEDRHPRVGTVQNVVC